MVAVKGSMEMCFERREGGIDIAQSIAMALDISRYMIPIQKHRARIISEKLFQIIGYKTHYRREKPTPCKNKYGYPTPQNTHSPANENSKQCRSQWDKKSFPEARTERTQPPHTSFGQQRLRKKKLNP